MNKIILKDGRELFWVERLSAAESSIPGGVPGHLAVQNAEEVSDSFPDDEHDERMIYESLAAVQQEAERLREALEHIVQVMTDTDNMDRAHGV